MDVQLKRGLLEVCVLAAIRDQDPYTPVGQDFPDGLHQRQHPHRYPQVKNLAQDSKKES